MSADNIIRLPPNEQPPEFLIGPFKVWRVQIDGRIIPRLTAFHDGDKIALVVDNRFSASFPYADAYLAASLIAHAIAIGEDYSHLGADTKDRPFAPIGHAIGGIDG